MTEPVHQTTILPCPFCGGLGRLTDRFGKYDPDGQPDWCIMCDACDYAIGCDAAQGAVVAKWNQRANPVRNCADDLIAALETDEPNVSPKAWLAFKALREVCRG